MTGILTDIVLHETFISPRSRWLFVECRTEDGVSGFGEATLQRAEAEVKRAAARLAPTALGRPARPSAQPMETASLPEAAFRSAMDQALHDIAARREGKRLADVLGARRARIPLYANINRRTVDRTPRGFAESARLALAAGFSALKLAPFDEVDEAARREGNVREAMQVGLQRIAAVSELIGPDGELMVDCHWRFGEAQAGYLVDAARDLRVAWLECPLPETEDMIPAIIRTRGRANRAGIRLAGCEELVGVEQNRIFAAAAAYDVMMPDVKYAGGIGEMMRLAELFERFGVAFSPHNPSGPIAHAASLHVAAAVACFDRLELQFDESPLFARLAAGPLPKAAGGFSEVPPGPGLGVALDPDQLAANAASRTVWSLTQVAP